MLTMISLKSILSLIFVLIATSHTVSANSCYHSGLKWNEVSGGGILWGYIESACHALGGSYGPANSNISPSVKRVCYNAAHGNRINFEIASNAESDQTLDFVTCYRTLKAMMDDCEHGGEQNQGDFHYSQDPNAGGC